MALAKAIPVKIGLVPPEGNRSYDFPLNFVGRTVINGALILSDVGMSSFQSAFFDASNCATPVTIIISGSNEVIVIPAFCQAIFPILQIGENFSFIATCTGAVVIGVKFFNFQQDLMIWNSAGTTVQGTVTVAGTVSTSPRQANYADASAAIVAAGVSQTMLGASARFKLFVKNPSSAAGQNIGAPESLFMNFTSPAGVNDGVSIELLPGESFGSGLDLAPANLVTVTAATVGHRFICKYN